MRVCPSDDGVVLLGRLHANRVVLAMRRGLTASSEIHVENY